MRPLIGISCNYDPNDFIGANAGRPSFYDWNYISGTYIYGVERAGGTPVILPVTEDPAALKDAVAKMDGILVSGGVDVLPLIYGEPMESFCQKVVPERDEYEILMIREAYRQKKPILGICRGMQVLNVAFGGTLYQDLEAQGLKNHSYAGRIDGDHAVHRVDFEPGSILCGVFGQDLMTNSRHHQAVKDPGENVRITARSEDGVIEGIEISGGHPFTVGVQWHPEMMQETDEHPLIFKAFIDAFKK